MTTCKKNIDIAKFIMAIIVVSIHTDPFIQFSNFYYFYHSIIGLPVPFFFLATGFFIGIKMKDTGGGYKIISKIYKTVFNMDNNIFTACYTLLCFF